MKTNETIKTAIGQSQELADMRSGKAMIPPPNYDIAVTLYERNPDGTDAEQGFLGWSRPQDFAVNEHMKYTRFGTMQELKQEDKIYIACFLVHLYWDGSRDEESAIEAVLKASYMFGYGEWYPTAPSDPLMQDDFWDSEKLGEPPNGYWNDDFELYSEHYPKFIPFSNFKRHPYEKIKIGEGQS